MEVSFHLVFNSFDFTMCNPPFYSSAEEVERSADGKIAEPNAVRIISDRRESVDANPTCDCS